MADSPVADEITTGSGIVSSNGRTLSSLSKEEYAEAMRILETLNKPAVTSFQREDGRIADCVDFYKQPALDNPNHTIQMRPTFFPAMTTQTRLISHPEGINRPPAINLTAQALLKFKCPPGTVPIPRTTMQDILRAESPFRFGKKPRGYRPPMVHIHQASSSSGKMPNSAEIASGFPSRSQFQEPSDPSSYCAQSSPSAAPLPSILVSKDNLTQSSTGGNGGQSNDVEILGGLSDKSFELQDPLS